MNFFTIIISLGLASAFLGAVFSIKELVVKIIAEKKLIEVIQANEELQRKFYAFLLEIGETRKLSEMELSNFESMLFEATSKMPKEYEYSIMKGFFRNNEFGPIYYAKRLLNKISKVVNCPKDWLDNKGYSNQKDEKVRMEEIIAPRAIEFVLDEPAKEFLRDELVKAAKQSYHLVKPLKVRIHFSPKFHFWKKDLVPTGDQKILFRLEGEFEHRK